MDVNIKNNIPNENMQDGFSIDFETERTPVRLGKSGKCFYVDFNDIGFPVRLSEARDEIIAYLEAKQKEYGIEDINNPKPNTGTVEDNIAALRDLDNNIRAAINKAFGYDVCKDVFGIVYVTGITESGECYYEKFFNAILPLIEKQFNVRVDKFSTRTKSYLAQKGKHPALYKK